MSKWEYIITPTAGYAECPKEGVNSISRVDTSGFQQHLNGPIMPMSRSLG